MTTRSMFIYAWDLWDAGIDDVLDRLTRMGINGISVTAVYHAGKFFLPHNPRKRVYYHRSGSIYYTPNREKYGLLQPQTGDAYEEYRQARTEDGSRDLLAAICSAARRRGMEVLAWVVGFHHSGFGERYPGLTVRNAFGESYRHALCPAHAETRQYVWGMAEDLIGAYDLDGLVLESIDYMGMLHGDHHELVGTGRLDELERYLGLCFCPSCMERARNRGIDAEAFRNEARRCVDRIAGGEEVTVPESYEAYLDMRVETVREVFARLRRIADEADKPVKLFSTLWMAYGSDPRLYGIHPERIGSYVDGWIACYPRTIEDVGPFLARASRSVPAGKLGAGVRLVAPETTSADHVNGYVREFQRHGIERLHFYNYGLASTAILSALEHRLNRR